MAFYETRGFILSLRVVQGLLTLLVLGLSAYGELPSNLEPCEEQIANNIISRQLVGRLLECRRAIIGRLHGFRRSHYSNHPRLPDIRANAVRRVQAEPRRGHRGH